MHELTDYHRSQILKKCDDKLCTVKNIKRKSPQMLYDFKKTNKVDKQDSKEKSGSYVPLWFINYIRGKS